MGAIHKAGATPLRRQTVWDCKYKVVDARRANPAGFAAPTVR